MSLEQAITDHAAAIRELAAAILGTASASSIVTNPLASKAEHFAKVEAGLAANKALSTVGLDNEMEKAVTQVEADAKAELTDAQIEAKAEKAAAKNAASAAGTATAAADTQTTAGAADTATAEAQTSYDYAKDVAPVLTKVAQKSRDSLVALLAKFGAKKGNELKADDYAAVLAAANELLAG